MLATVELNRWLTIAVAEALVAAVAGVDGIVLDLVAFRMDQSLVVAHYTIKQTVSVCVCVCV